MDGRLMSLRRKFYPIDWDALGKWDPLFDPHRRLHNPPTSLLAPQQLQPSWLPPTSAPCFPVHTDAMVKGAKHMVSYSSWRILVTVSSGGFWGSLMLAYRSLVVWSAKQRSILESSVSVVVWLALMVCLVFYLSRRAGCNPLMQLPCKHFGGVYFHV